MQLDVAEREALLSLVSQRKNLDERIEAVMLRVAQRVGLKREEINSVNVDTGEIVQWPPGQAAPKEDAPE